MTESSTQTQQLALITGASSGLGAEFTHQLAHLGYNLILISRREDRLVPLANQLRNEYKIDVTTQRADLSQLSDIEEIISIIKSLPTLNLLVNNAGFGTVGRFNQVDPQKQLAMMNVHMVAPVLFCRAALPGMINRNLGSIINVSSIAGMLPIRNVLYHSTKAFLISFSKGLHLELQGTQVKVQALCPGFTRTEFHDTPEYTHFSRRSIPGFLWMSAEQIVGESLKALDHHGVICIPGAFYQFVGALAKNNLTAPLINFFANLIIRKRKPL